MKRILPAFLLTVLALPFASCASSGTGAASSETPNVSESNSIVTGDTSFRVTSSGIVDGYLDPAYGANGTVFENNLPALSVPLEISGSPGSTACYALMMDDPDSISLCGFSWVHWTAANFTQTSLPEGFSASADATVLQGKNDYGTIGFAGPTPPDKDHKYRITVYALDKVLDLSNGFSKEEFPKALEGHVLASALTEGVYKK
jgi:Raf kinase inhibitor-like YbhB/YbcL family protein